MATSDQGKRPRPGPWPPAPTPQSNTEAAKPPVSWAKQTGFKPKFSGETNASNSGQIPLPLPSRPKELDSQVDLEAGRPRSTAATDKPTAKPPSTDKDTNPAADNNQNSIINPTVRKRRDSDGAPGPIPVKSTAAKTNGPPPGPPDSQQQPCSAPHAGDDDDVFVSGHSRMKYELRDTPGLVPIGLYGFQHYLTMLGSLILVPLVFVPAMGGTHV